MGTGDTCVLSGCAQVRQEPGAGFSGLFRSWEWPIAFITQCAATSSGNDVLWKFYPIYTNLNLNVGLVWPQNKQFLGWEEKKGKRGVGSECTADIGNRLWHLCPGASPEPHSPSAGLSGQPPPMRLGQRGPLPWIGTHWPFLLSLCSVICGWFLIEHVFAEAPSRVGVEWGFEPGAWPDRCLHELPSACAAEAADRITRRVFAPLRCVRDCSSSAWEVKNNRKSDFYTWL